MKIKKYKNQYSKKVNKNLAKKKEDFKWIITITIMAFVISLIFSFITETIIPKTFVLISIIIVIFFIILGVIFDMIGISVTVADIKIFNSMATKKIIGAKTAVKLMKKASKVSSFCNDVIGDICGILSGSAGISIALNLSKIYDLNLFVITLLITCLISSLTIGGKALGKTFAINKANKILYKFSKFLLIFNKNLDK